MREYDVLVIGGGHAGCEAAHAAARMGAKTALLTLNPERIGFMSCNPAMGGLAKGQLIKEIDALGGIMGRVTDRAAIQYRKLNSSKGPAVRSSRAQCDKALYALEMQRLLSNVPGLDLLNDEATQILTEGNRVIGLELARGDRLKARNVIVTTGTFLRAIMHTGERQDPGGRLGDRSSIGLSASIANLGFRLRRLKTGTPPRLHRESIDYTQVEAQPGDERPTPFSFYYREDRFPYLNQVNCFITYTNSQAHEIISQNIHTSPMYSGAITGIGPRYCPSIEDKVKKFSDKDRHQIFLEPEGLTTDEIYVNGISTSLPRDVQDRFVRSIAGLENAVFTKYGYAVEYDAIDARQLAATFESKDIEGLFFAGQICGTSGYEEAGAQGLLAGINAALRVRGGAPFMLGRSDAYIGVLADDLVLKGSDEPYRMFTSRAEYRLLLREDNADLRLSPKGYALGLLSEKDYATFSQRKDSISDGLTQLRSHFFIPSESTSDWLKACGAASLKDRASAFDLLKRPEISWSDLIQGGFEGAGYPADVQEQIEIQVKYAGYIERDLELLEGVRRDEELVLPLALDYSQISGLSTEVRARLGEIRPQTLGQAARIQGVTPAAVASLMIYVKMLNRRSK